VQQAALVCAHEIEESTADLGRARLSWGGGLNGRWDGNHEWRWGGVRVGGWGCDSRVDAQSEGEEELDGGCGLGVSVPRSRTNEFCGVGSFGRGGGGSGLPSCWKGERKCGLSFVIIERFEEG